MGYTSDRSAASGKLVTNRIQTGRYFDAKIHSGYAGKAYLCKNNKPLMKRIILLAVSASLSFVLCSMNTYNFKSLDVKDGVPDNFIHEMLRDEYGFMWFISGQMLNRYDGYDFRQYALPAPGEHTNYLLKEDRHGNIWVRSNEHFFHYDRQKDRLDPGFADLVPCESSGGTPSFFDVDYNGDIWFSVRDGELICWKGTGNFRRFSIPSGGTVKSLEAREDEVFFLLSDGRVFKADNENAESKDSGDESEAIFLTEISLSDKLYQKMYLDMDDVLWFYVPHSSGDNLIAFDLKTRSFRKIGRTINFVTSIADDRRGNLWISTDNAGIFVYDKADGTVTQLQVRENARYSLLSNHINCLYLDFQDIMWVGTSKRGISYTCLNSPLFEKVDVLNLDDVSCVLEDGDGNLWFGTDGNGVACRRPSGEFLSWEREKGGIPGNLIVCSFLDSKGRVWFGTFGNGLFYHENGRFVRVRHTDRTKDEFMRDIRSIDEDAYGNIWIGTIAYGLFCYGADGSMTDYTMENSMLASNGIADLYCGQDRMLYIATSNGPFVMDTRTRKLEPIPAGEGDTARELLTSICKDSRGLLWIGGPDGVRAIREESGEWVHLDHSGGLSHDHVRGICEDRYGNMWLTTDVGITQIVVVDDPVKSFPAFRCRRYYDEDGLHDIMFNLNSLCCLRSGDVLMGGIGGVLRTSPSAKPAVPAWSNIEFTALYVANRRIEAGEKVGDRVILPLNIQVCDEIDLNYPENSFSVSVSSLNFPTLHKNQLLYRLKGHTDWMPLERNMIHFNRLHPDTYELQVKFADVEAPSENVATMVIRIRPPFWQSPPAYVIYALLLCLSVFLLVFRIRQKTKLKYKLRIQDMDLSHQREMEEAHMRFFTNISHDLRTPLSLVITPLERLMQKPTLDGRTKTELKEIHKNAGVLMDEINQLLEFRKLSGNMSALNLSYGNLSDLVREVCKSFQPYSLKNITLALTLPADDVKMRFDRDKMRRILLNLLSNAYKFNSENGTVLVSMDLVRKEGTDMVRLSVADTGVGIPDASKERIFDRFYQEKNPADMTGSGIGLNIVKEYVRLHGGTVDVVDNHPKGSVFVLLFPFEAEETGMEDAKTVPAPENTAEEQGTTLLIVEDNDNFRRFLMECLQEHYSVVSAANGREALSVLEKTQVHLVISDVMMPKMDGLELCRRIKEDIRFSHIPVILLTAKTADDNIIQGLKEGSDDYITKPFNLDILLLRVSKLLEWSQNNHAKFKTIDVSPSEITITSLDEELIAKAIRLVEENISNMDFTVDELSSAVGMTRGHLYKKLVAITGKTPLDFIRTIRIKRGRQLLEKSQLGVADIAWRVGFSPKQFARYFKETFGELPSEFKRRCSSPVSADNEV